MSENNLRYHFMLKERMPVTNEIVLHFMDFKGGRILKPTIKELNETTNKKLKEDARAQWGRIEKAHAIAPKGIPKKPLE